MTLLLWATPLTVAAQAAAAQVVRAVQVEGLTGIVLAVRAPQDHHDRGTTAVAQMPVRVAVAAAQARQESRWRSGTAVTAHLISASQKRQFCTVAVVADRGESSESEARGAAVTAVTAQMVVAVSRTRAEAVAVARLVHRQMAHRVALALSSSDTTRGLPNG